MGRKWKKKWRFYYPVYQDVVQCPPESPVSARTLEFLDPFKTHAMSSWISVKFPCLSSIKLFKILKYYLHDLQINKNGETRHFVFKLCSSPQILVFPCPVFAPSPQSQGWNILTWTESLFWPRYRMQAWKRGEASAMGEEQMADLLLLLS